jgi:hypothetical protein
MRTSRALLIALAACGALPASAGASCAPGGLTITDGALVSGTTAGAPLACVLEEVARLTGAELRGTVDDATVAFDLRAVPLESAFSRLLQDRSYLLVFREERLARIALLGGSNGVALASPPASPETTTAISQPSGIDVEGLRHDLLEEPRTSVRKAALDRLQAMPRPPIELVAKMAQDDFDPALRRQALSLIAAQSSLDPAGRAAAEVLVRNDPDPSVRATAAEVLAREAARASAGAE